jgi:hypothetical protein
MKNVKRVQPLAGSYAGFTFAKPFCR